jgi:hypothetical protein
MHARNRPAAGPGSNRPIRAAWLTNCRRQHAAPRGPWNIPTDSRTCLGVSVRSRLVRTIRRTLCGGRIRCASTTALSISIAHVCGVQPRSISACSNALRALWYHTTHSGLPSGTLRATVLPVAAQAGGWVRMAAQDTTHEVWSEGQSISITHSILVESLLGAPCARGSLWLAVN